MFETMTYRYRLWCERRSRDRLLGAIDKAIKAARREGDTDEEQSLVADYFHVQDEAEDAILLLRSRYLHQLADRYLISIPPLNDDESWTKSEIHPRRVYLSAKGAATVHSLIREEQKHLREARDAWLPWLGAATGFIGALTGLIAIWHHGN